MLIMKSLLALSLVSPVLIGAFVIVPSLVSKIRVTVSTTTPLFCVPPKFNVQNVTSQVDDATRLQAAEQQALETKNLRDGHMEQEIEHAVLAAKQAMQAVVYQQEKDNNNNDDNLIDADALLGESSEEVIEWLSQGLLDSESFQVLIHRRKEEARKAKQQQIKEARRIQKALQQERLQKRFCEYMIVGLSGIMVGGAMGLYAWHAIPEYLGDHVTPFFPTFLGGGIMGCSFIIIWSHRAKPQKLSPGSRRND